MKLSEISVGSKITLRVITKESKAQYNALIAKQVKENIAVITLLHDSDKKLSFENVRTDMEFSPDGDIPLIWYNVKVVYYKENDYALQVFADGTKLNRRGSFRVGVSAPAKLKCSKPNAPREIMIKDVSLTGFSITDRKKELNLDPGDTISVAWEDFGHMLNLSGRVVRIEELENGIVYGLEICNVCKDLPSYISKKQRQKR